VKPRRCNVPGRRLGESERQTVRDLLYSTRFIDDTPTEIYATLLDEKIYHCSVRTIYRLLKEDGANQPRGRAKRHTAYTKPELLATRPNQLWSWDITRLKGPRPWTYFYLYVIMDVFSRYVVGFMVAYQESQALARELIDHTLVKHAIMPGQLTLHADRGSAMTSKSVALLLSDLGVAKTHSRPHVSNDNPYSEAQFKTLKYRPEFPDRFGTVCGARAVCAHLFAWYNGEHHHGGIALLTPAMVHYGRAVEVIEARQSRLDAAYKAHPQRFVNHPPQHPELPPAVWINPPVTDAVPKGTESTICVT
jgi:putative transposase